MKRLLIVLLIALMSVGCSNKNSQQSSQATPESSQTSEKNLTIEDVEGYWDCKSDEEGILLKLGWKNDIDLYYSDGSKEKNSYNIIDSDSNSIEIEMRDEDKTTNEINVKINTVLEQNKHYKFTGCLESEIGYEDKYNTPEFLEFLDNFNSYEQYFDIVN